MAPQSIFRNPEAKHYSVLHRSQRDPLINDPSNGERVLHEIQRKNQSRAQVNDPTDSDLPSKTSQTKPSIPSSFNIFYSDPDYDYLQHLKPIGTSSDGIFIGKTTPNNPKKSYHHPQRVLLSSPDHLIPESVRPTPDLQTLSYQDHLEFALPSNSAIPDDSLLPIDDNPALLEVLDALEDEAYVEEDTDDQFFDSIIKHGEIDPNQPPDDDPETLNKSQSKSKSASFQFDDTSSTASEILNHLKPQSFQQKVNRSAAPSRASLAGSSFSMSSSAMFRNEGLTDLDDRFDQIEREYQSDDNDDEDSDCSEMTTTPKVREDFDDIMDEFLDRFEVLGGKMKPALAGKTPIEKLNTLRSELLGPSSHDGGTEDSDMLERKLMKEKILSHLKSYQNRDEFEAGLKPHRDDLVLQDVDDDHRYENKWDCQTILTTYSNLENHPRVIKIREAIGESEGAHGRKKKSSKLMSSATATTTHTNGVGKIGIDRTTGFPIVNGKIIKPSPKHLSDDESSDASSDAPDGEDLNSADSVVGTIKRDRNEDKESKKIRKSEVKAERAARRQIKKSTKQSFTNEKNKQQSINSKLLVKKSIDIAGVGGKHVMTLV